jgi:hypothetical protein
MGWPRAEGREWINKTPMTEVRPIPEGKYNREIEERNFKCFKK